MFVREPLGGLVTKSPPMQLRPEQSPDLLNVLMGDGSVDSRGGFAPLFKDRMLMNSVRNAGYHATSRLTNDAGSADGDFLVVPGCLIAGHRPVYDQANNIAFDLFFEVGDLTAQHGGNSNSGGGVSFDGAPYTIKVRPIFSKGPVKRSADTAALALNAAIAWNTTVSTVWGADADSGMPFCLYLYNNGTGTNPSWQFRLSAHANLLAGPAWSLQTATSSVPVVLGGRYHIIGMITQTRVLLRIARIIEGQTPSYTNAETTFLASAVGWNKCPFQVFDCPQQFIEATTTGSATQRPGLALESSTEGGYWFACKRAEGRIEDIAVWLGDFANSALDRQTKLDLNTTLAGELTNYWNMVLPGTDYVQDATSRGNHLYFVPRGPVCDRHSGGKDGASWFFNGITSYALIDVGHSDATVRDHPNWNFFDAGAKVGAMRGLVLNNLAHGIQVEFWVDSIEPQFEQVIAEIHGVLRLAINESGNLVGYCRSGGGANAQLHGQLYQGPVTGTQTLRPGQRYTVVLMRRAGGTDLDLYVDGAVDATVGGLNANSSASGRPVSGVTLGMGSWQIMTRGSSQTDTAIAAANQINTDARSGFVGRIESFAIVTTPDAGLLAPQYKSQGPDDWDFDESRAMTNPVAASRVLLQPNDPGDTIRSVGGGAVVSVAGQEEAGEVLRHVVKDSSTSPQLYEIHAETLDNSGTASGQQGHSALAAVGMRIGHVFAYYRLKADDRDEGYGGSFVNGLEWRYSGSTVTTANQARNTNKGVHVQFSVETDLTETIGPLQKRCVEPDLLTETEDAVYTHYTQNTHRQRPYPFRSPLEVGPRWAQGFVQPIPGQAEVTLVQDWEVQAGSRRFTITACGRQLYWAKPLWEADSPFAEAEPRSVFLAGLGYLFVKATSSTMNFNWDTRGVSFEGWVKPFSLDGRRLLFAKMTPSSSVSQINWLACVQDGSLVLIGTEDGGTRTWSFAEGTIPGGGTFVRRTKTIRVGVWNHIRIVMGFSLSNPGVVVHINGHEVAMVDANDLTGSLQTDAQGDGTATDEPTNELYVGGLPDGVIPSISVTVSGVANTTLPMLSWYGLMTEFRFAPGAQSQPGHPPRTRFTPSTTTTLLHMNEGSGWRLTNSGTGATDHGHSQAKEFIAIAEGLEESAGHRYHALTFRDQLIVTNGESRPQAIRFGAFTDPAPLTVRQLGILPPVVADTGISSTPGAGGAGVSDGDYQVEMTFFDRFGNESEPTVLGFNAISGGPYVSVTMLIQRMPRSHDPQVIGRRLYVSAVGGGTPIFNRDLIDNDGFTHDVWIYNSAGLASVAGERQVPPRARQLAVAGASLILADLPDEEAGQNAFAVSRGDNPSYFTDSSLVVIDSQDGKPLIGVRGNQGQVFLSKRDSIFGLSVGAIIAAVRIDAAIREVFHGDAVGAGSVAANNLIYGAGDRGVFAFNNSVPVYLSQDIEPTWRSEIDGTDGGLARMFGAYLRPDSEYWLSVLRRGQLQNDTIFVLSLVGKPAWSRLQVPPHSCLATVADPITQQPIIVLGTSSGAVLRLRDDLSLDYSDDAPNAFGAITLDSAIGLSGLDTQLTVDLANFDTVLGGMAGAPVTLYYIDTLGGPQTTVRHVLRNSRDTIYWTDPIPDLVGWVALAIGSIDAYWTSPWIAKTEPNREQKVTRIPLEVVPRSGNLTVRLASIRQGESPVAAFPTATTRYEEFTVAMTNGWPDDMPRPTSHATGHYHRLRVGTSGVRKPFGLIGYGLEIEALQATSHAGRRS